MDNNIKIIDVFGSADSKGAEHHYSYFTPNYSMYSGWSKYVSDLREELAPGIQECYCCFCTKEGWWISKIIRNPHDLREDPIMVSVCIGENRPKSGKKAVELLDGFVDFFIIHKIWNDEETEKKLKCVDQDLELVPCALIESALPTVNHKSAYRTFSTMDELFDCISFLPQQGYKDYSRVFFVPREQSSGMPIECIDETIPLKRIYTLHYSEDCSSPSGKTEIMEGDRVKLVYTKQGLEPFEKYIKGGENSDFAFVEGNTMHIRSGKEIGLIHNRIIEIICKDKSDKRINDFSLRNYTQQNNAIIIRGKTVIVPENEKGEIIVWVDPSDEKYDSQKVNLTGVLEDHKDVCLEAKYYNVVFKMKGKTFKTTEDTMMSPLEAKNNWAEYDCEIDDLNRTVCFTVHRFSPERKHHEQNHFVREELPLGKRIGNFFKEWWVEMVLGLLALLFVYGIYVAIARFWLDKTPWPFGTKTEKVEEIVTNEETTQVTVQPKQEEFNPVVDSLDIMKKHDIDYLLREKKIWVRDSIQSKEFQAMYDDIAGGEVEKVISHYNNLFGEPNKTNETFKLIVEGLKKINQTGDQLIRKRVSDEMKRLSKKESIKLDELLTSVNIIVRQSQSGKGSNQAKNAPASSNDPATKNKTTRADITSESE